MMSTCHFEQAESSSSQVDNRRRFASPFLIVSTESMDNPETDISEVGHEAPVFLPLAGIIIIIIITPVVLVEAYPCVQRYLRRERSSTWRYLWRTRLRPGWCLG